MSTSNRSQSFMNFEDTVHQKFIFKIIYSSVSRLFFIPFYIILAVSRFKQIKATFEQPISFTVYISIKSFWKWKIHNVPTDNPQTQNHFRTRWCGFILIERNQSPLVRRILHFIGDLLNLPSERIFHFLHLFILCVWQNSMKYILGHGSTTCSSWAACGPWNHAVFLRLQLIHPSVLSLLSYKHFS